MARLGLIGSLHEENSKYKIINVKIHLANVQYCYNCHGKGGAVPYSLRAWIGYWEVCYYNRCVLLFTLLKSVSDEKLWVELPGKRSSHN